MEKTFPQVGYTIHNRVQLIRGGKEYFNHLTELIRSASQSFHLQIYILDGDETGRTILGELMAAAARGVAVFVLADGYASQGVSKQLAELKASGVKFRWFEPLLRSKHFYFGRRLHHKVAVADGSRALVGGINLSNRYNDLSDQPAWLDWAILTEGQAAGKLFFICQDLWNKSGWGKKKSERFNLKLSAANIPDKCLVGVRREDWVRRRIEISSSYLKMLSNASRDVYMMSSYFLPGRIMRRSIAAAAARGVKITVITAGKSDIHMAKHAERYLYRWMIRKNMRLYEYQPKILHGKISCADGQWATTGSYNLNYLSAYASIELNLEVLDEDFAASVQEQLEEIIRKDCVRITEDGLVKHYPWYIRFWQRISYDLIRFVFYLFTFYFKQDRK